jgi:hypothetical protein
LSEVATISKYACNTVKAVFFTYVL